MAENDLIVEWRDDICTLIFNRPQRRNALSTELLHQMTITLEELEKKEKTRVVVFRGAGEESFSAGFDLGFFQRRDAEEYVQARLDAESFLSKALAALSALRYPTIAMIHGFCMGAGFEIASRCDIRIADDRAKFSMPPAKLGMVYIPEGIWQFMHIVGTANAKEIFLHGGTFDAIRAREMGLLARVAPAADLSAVTYTFAEELASNAPLAVQGTKLIFRKLMALPPMSEADKGEIQGIISKAQGSEDFKEALLSFREKRKPQFCGK